MNTLFLATVIGWYFVLFSLFLLFRRETLVIAMKEIAKQRGLMLLVGSTTLIFGLLMVISHNIWMMGWPLIVTLISWWVLLSGILRLMWPETVVGLWHNMLRHSGAITGASAILLLIGLFLLFNVYVTTY